MSYSLIPGLESFMEDTEVNVEVAVDAPEAIEEAEETADASAEIAETTEEAEATDEQAEMIMSQYMELGKRYEHVKQYGIDRTFMRLYNSNGELSRAFRYRFPSCESFDSTGSPYSAESQAYISGMEGILSDIWEFIVKLCKKIGAFFSRLIEAVRVRFGNINDQVGRLRQMRNERSADVDNIDDVDATTYKFSEVDEVSKIYEKEADSNKLHEEVVKKAVDTYLQAVQQWSKGAVQNDAKKMNDNAKNYREALKETKKAVRKGLDQVKSNEKVKDLTPGDVDNFLNLASKVLKESDKLKSAYNVGKALTDNAARVADNMRRRQDEGHADERILANGLSTMLNVYQQLISLKTEVNTKVAGMCVRAASMKLRYMKKS